MRENKISVEIYDYGPLLSKEEIKGLGMKALNFLLAQTFLSKRKLYQRNKETFSWRKGLPKEGIKIFF